MKKPFTLILVLSVNLCLAQTAPSTWLRVQSGNGVPTDNPNTPAPKTSYVRKNNLTGKWYEYNTVTKLWNETDLFKAEKGDKGDPGAQGLQGLPGQTGAQGVPGKAATVAATATAVAGNPVGVTVNNSGTSNDGIFNFQFTIPPSAPTTALSGYESPDFYGAVHRNQTITAANVGQYSAVGAVIGDQVDWAAISMACKNANKEAILLYGEYFVNRTIYLNKFDYFDVIISNGAIIYTVNSTAYPVISRLPATDGANAVRMESTIIFIQNLDIQISGDQVGFQPQPASNVTCFNVRVFSRNTGQGTAFLFQFDMQAYLLNCLAHSTYDGFYLMQGGYPGASITSAQNNWTTLQTCMGYNVTHIPFKIEQCYGVKLLSCVAQGNNSCLYAIYFDSQGSGTVKDFTIDGFHWEYWNGATGAIVYIRMQNGSAELTNLNFQSNVAGTYIDAGCQQAMIMIVKRLSYWKDNSKFKSDSNTFWNFYDCLVITAQALTNPGNWITTGGGVIPGSKARVI